MTEDYLKDNIQDPKKIEAFIKEIVIVNIGQAAIERKDVESVKKLWVEAYRNACEELKKKGIAKDNALHQPVSSIVKACFRQKPQPRGKVHSSG